MSRSLIRAVALCAIAVVPVIFAPATSAAIEGAGLTGNVSIASGSLPAGSQVVAYHLATEQTFSAAVNASGAFELTGLPAGYFDVAIQTPDGLFLTDRVVSLKPGKVEKLSVKLNPAAPGAPAGQARSFPGASGPTAGVASVTPKVSPFVNFLKTPAGTATAAAVGAGVIGAVAGGGSSNTPVSISPIVP